ncbi:cell cycle checkpoint protein [Exophiala viscosa]|uniref:Cell cycle checkpoint protein n=1 Tax=Exophiala viscosa TaxID=2486360 RepID=A0AAN6IBD4_9EURO|nr:cell cycle checkpoint protein [Exophiala viscosa]
MAPRPAKRQRRSTIVLSDDSDEAHAVPTTNAPKSGIQREITLDGKTSQTVSPAKKAKVKLASTKTAVKSSPKSSPEKARKGTRSKNEPEKSKSLHNFFGKATEDERWRKRSETPEVNRGDGELGDAIEDIDDDELSEDTLRELGVKTDTASAPLDRRKPVPPVGIGLKSAANGSSLPSSQRFVRPAQVTRPFDTNVLHDQPQDEGHHPWADRYGPSNLEELVVHKKKVADVQNWLQGRIDGRNAQKVLVLKGPAGSGKTMTLSLLAKAMGLQLVSWHNPNASDLGATIAAQFDEFLNRGGQFGGLAFHQETTAADQQLADSSHRVLVIEDFPATLTRLSNALQSFRSVILQYLARSRPTSSARFLGKESSSEVSPPVVIIISETLISSSTALSDSFTAHRLLGPEILNHPFVTVMEFNPVAPTFVTKALDLVMKKEARDSRRRRMPGPAIIQKLAEMGDVRSAVNSLEFLCLRGGDGAEWSGTVAVKAKKTSKDSVPLTEMEKNSLQLVSQRETTLDMFHAAGKIVYNKREDPRVLDTRAEPPPKPPDHLMHQYTPKVSQVDIEALLNETGTDIQTFISTLHENYVLSCNGDTFENCFDGCSEILSSSDILNPDSRPSRRAKSSNATIIQASLQAGSSDTLRQDEISFQVATRGLLFNLPYPVNRASPPGGRKGDTYKMFYPASLRLWKPTEELESLIDMFIYGAEGIGKSGTGLASGQGTAAHDDGVASWQSRTFAATASAAEAGTDGDEEDDESSVTRPLRHTKDTLTLEVLPYMTQIFVGRKKDTSLLERITKFKPAAFLSSAEAGDESFEDGEAAATNEIHEGRTNGIVGAGSGTKPSGLAAKTGQLAAARHDHHAADVDASAMDKLYISDDDIEDD